MTSLKCAIIPNTFITFNVSAELEMPSDARKMAKKNITSNIASARNL